MEIIELTPEFVALVKVAEERNMTAELVYLALMDMKENKNASPLSSIQIASKDLELI
jgi:hypothetical protein